MAKLLFFDRAIYMDFAEQKMQEKLTPGVDLQRSIFAVSHSPTFLLQINAKKWRKGETENIVFEKLTPGVDLLYVFSLSKVHRGKSIHFCRQQMPNFVASNSCERVWRTANRSTLTIEKSTPGVDFIKVWHMA